MSKRFFVAAFAAGLAVLAWIAQGFAGVSWLALGMTVLIAGTYLLGAFELLQFRSATAGLAQALAPLQQPPSHLADWLERVPPSLRNAVRGRVEGDRGGLPGPALTPYLLGLLVMLGMLGTFLGLVVTFKGTVFALEGSTDLQAIRTALAGPIKGLGLSFGTSVAGVASSAMLGLMSALSRRERLDVLRQLDTRIATVLRPFSPAHQREASLHALQAQAGALPEVVGRLDALMERLEQRAQQLDAQVLAQQERFHREATLAYTELARSVGTSLQDSLVAGARAGGESLQPLVASAMAQLAHDAQRTHERLGELAATQVEELSARFGALAGRLQADQAAAEAQRLQAWRASLQALAADLDRQWRGATDAALARHRAVCEALERSAQQVTGQASEQAVHAIDTAARLLDDSRDLVRARTEAEGRWIEHHAQRMDQLAGVWRTELAALRQEESARGQAAVERLDALQAAVAGHLGTLGAALEAPLTRLLHTASEVPQAAAGVIAQLRQEMSGLAERDNLALQERTALLERLAALMDSVQQAAGEQRAAIEALVASASSALGEAGARAAQVLEARSADVAGTAAHVAASAVELSTLAESFGQSVQLFQASNDKLTDTLERIEASLHRSTARSDEQLAYYVAQAREVIDLSIASQQGLVDSLRQLQARPGHAVALAGEDGE